MPKLLVFPELKDHAVRYGRRRIDRHETARKGAASKVMCSDR